MNDDYPTGPMIDMGGGRYVSVDDLTPNELIERRGQLEAEIEMIDSRMSADDWRKAGEAAVQHAAEIRRYIAERRERREQEPAA
jgi:hypothetical protein